MNKKEIKMSEYGLCLLIVVFIFCIRFHIVEYRFDKLKNRVDELEKEIKK